MRSNQTTKWLAAASVLAFLAGCGGCYTPAEERHLVLTVTKPQIGQTLTLKDNDTEPAPNGRDGLQYDVEVKLEWEDVNGTRTAADVESAALSLTKPDGTTEDGVAGTVAPGGIATFVGVTFDQEGTWLLKPVARELSSHTTSADLTVSVKIVLGDKVLPKVTSVTIPEDLNGDFKLNATELPNGSTLTVQYAATDFTSGRAWVETADGTKHSLDVPLPSSTIPTDLPASAGTEQSYDLRVHLLTDDNLENDLSNSPNRNSEAIFTVAVDQVAPTVVITQPQDRDGGYPTNTLLASATVTGAEGQTVAFTAQLLDGGAAQPAGMATVANGVASGPVTLINPGVQTLTATVQDVAGNVGSGSTQIWVNTDACTVKLTSPATTPIYVSTDANVAAAGFQYSIQGNAISSSGTAGCGSQVINVVVGGATFTGVTNPDGSFSVEITLPTNQLTGILVQVDNGAGQFGSAAADIYASSTAFASTYPSNNAVLSISNDFNTQTPLIQTSLTYAPAALPANSHVDICMNAVPSNNPSASACAGVTGWYVVASGVTSPANSFTYPDGKQYQLKGVMIAGTSVWAETPAVTLTADSQRPTISSISFPADSNADQKINSAEYGSGISAVIAFGGVEDGQTVAVFNDSTNAACGNATVTNNSASVALTCVPSGFEGTLNLRVQISDAAGNPNDLTPNGSAFKSIAIDRVAPTFSFSAPSKALLGTPDDASSSSAGFQLAVAGVVPADATSVTFTISGGSTNLSQTVTPTGTSAGYTFDLPGSGDVTYTLTAVAKDAAGNSSSTTSLTVRVDLSPPTVQIVQPTSAGNPYGSYTLTVAINVSNNESGVANVYSRVGTTDTLKGSVQITNGSGSGPVTFPNGTQDVVATFNDPAGNTGTGVSAGIVINAVGCSLSLSAPSAGTQYLGRNAGTYNSSNNTLTYTIAGSSGCTNRTVSFFEGTGASRTSIAASVNTSGTGSFSQTVSYAEGAHHLEVEIDNGAGVITLVSADFNVDLTPPVLSVGSPSNATPLFYVASTNLHLRPPAQAGYIADGDSAAPNAQASFTYTVTGAVSGTATVLYGGSAIAGPTQLTTDPQTLNTTANLAQATSGQLEIRVVDSAGNQASWFANATVDVLAPAAPTFTIPTADRHSGQLVVNWTGVANDGTSSSSGNVTSYDVRWTTDVILANGIQNETDFFDTTKTLQQTGLPTPGAAGTAETTTLTVPPMATYGVLVRAVDAVGNYSAFVPSTQYNNVWPATTFGQPTNTSSTNFGSNVVAGRITATATSGNIPDDFVTASYAVAPGTVHIYRGNSAGVASITRQDISPSEAGVVSFGFDFDVGQVGDAASENLEDLVVAAPSSNSNAGRVYLYFGKAGGVSTASGDYVIFAGNASSQLGRGVAVINDINGDGLGEIVMSSHNEDSGRGRVYLFYGRSKSAWVTLAGGSTIAMTSADRTFQGPLPIAGSNNQFGRNRGYASLGDLNGDSVPDFTVPDSLDSVSKLFVFSGATVNARAATSPLQTGTGATPNDALQTLSQGVLGGGVSRDGFGSRAEGASNIFGAAARNLVVSQPFDSKLFIFSASGGTFPATANQTIAGRSGFSLGSGLAVADLNGDGRPDLVAAEGANNASLWFLFSKGASGYDTTTGAGFMQARVTSTSFLGLGVDVGDFDGDGKPDIAAGDPTNGPGLVTLWH